jgi:hypothetical protein
MESKEQYIGLKRTEKSSLKKFNIEEARGWTIERLQQIEWRINRIIIEHFKPEDKDSFEKIVLNSSIMDFGSKLKILININSKYKSQSENIRKLAAIRNGFAHAKISDIIHILADKVDEETFNLSHETETRIEIMNSQGELKIKNAYEYLVEFWELYHKIKDFFDN